MENKELTTHERHSRLVSNVKKFYQVDNPGARLFKNTSGWAWQGQMVNKNNNLIINNPRPVKFGIPEPSDKRDEKKSGGADLLGETPFTICEIFPALQMNIIDCDSMGSCQNCLYKDKFPILTAIECKTGNSQLKKNQKIFKKWVQSVRGIYYVARECMECDGSGEIQEGKPHHFIFNCPCCNGQGFYLDKK